MGQFNLAAADFQLARRPAHPIGVVARFETTVGVIEAELMDEKPVTTANFIKYANVQGWADSILHRWVPDFIVQGGGFYRNQSGQIVPVQTMPAITNEFNVGPRVSNTYGTIAMAKTASSPNTATAQWFFNLDDNSENLDNQNGGFTVFGRVISGTNVLNKFVPPPPTHGIYIEDLTPGTPNTAFETVPVTTNSLINVKISFHRYMNLVIAKGGPGESVLNFSSVPGKRNVIQISSSTSPAWTDLTNWVATATTSTATLRNRTNSWERYRVRIDY